MDVGYRCHMKESVPARVPLFERKRGFHGPLHLSFVQRRALRDLLGICCLATWWDARQSVKFPLSFRNDWKHRKCVLLGSNNNPCLHLIGQFAATARALPRRRVDMIERVAVE